MFPIGAARKTVRAWKTTVWNALAAAIVALAACLVALGRADPLRPGGGWLLGFAALYAVCLVWMFWFSGALTARIGAAGSRLHAVAAVSGPLVALALLVALGVYVSDALNHQIRHFWQPTATVLALLAALATAVAQVAVLERASGSAAPLSGALERCGRWAIPLSLAMLGFFQAGSYIWTIGNDFTRYWNIADGISAWEGYSGMLTLPLYHEIGEPKYTIDLPGFSMFLVPSFALFGHDTFGAYAPILAANAVLPVAVYALYRGAGIGRPLAYAGACALLTMPFLRLYTLNAALPDAVFLAFLMGTGVMFERVVISHQSSVLSPQSLTLGAQGPAIWALFGLLAGFVALTRPEGMMFLGFMALPLIPRLRERGPWIAGAVGLGMLAPFVLVWRTTYGYFWPNNAGDVFGPRFVGEHMEWFFENGLLARYAVALGLSTEQFLASVGLLALLCAAGTVWLARWNWRLLALPAAGMASLAAVLITNPIVSGARLWFDFFRHFSYGLLFLSLPTLFVVDRLSRWVGGRLGERPAGVTRDGAIRRPARHWAAALVIAVALLHLNLLAHPSQTYGAGSTQLLNSDVWVSLPDLAEHRYRLPQLPHVWGQDGVLIIEPEFDRWYLIRHLDAVSSFFEPYSTINVDRGSQYVVTSLLVMLFGLGFVFGGGGARPSTG